MIQDNQKENSVDLKEVLAPYIRYWYVYIICIIIALLGVKIYSRYTIPEYNTFATILIKSNENNTNTNALTALSDVNGLRSESIDNELLILRSKKLLKNVVENLNLYTTFTKNGKILSTEVYSNFPLKAIVNITDSTATFSQDFILNYDNNNVYIKKGESDNFNKYAYNQPIKFDFGSIRFIKKNSSIKSQENETTVNISDAKTITNHLKSKLTVERYEDYNSAIIISMVNSQKQKAKDIINDLIKVFNEDAIEDKNIQAKKTSDFINDRIRIIDEELGGVEKNIADFKESSRFSDPLNAIGDDLGEIKEIGKEILDLNTREEFTNIYKNQVAKSSINEILPINLLSKNEELSGYISQYNEIVIKTNTQKQGGGTDQNPVIVAKNKQLKELKQAILSSIQKELSLLRNQKRLLNSKLAKYESAYNKIPEQERVLRSINRQQTIKENLYLLLLQKREENAITLASSSNKAKLVDSPESIGPINTKLTTYYLGAGLLGFLIPIGVIYLLSLLNTKIENRKDLSKIVGDYPILGELPSLKKEEANDVVSKDLSMLSEAFRIIRTNLQFMLGNIKGDKGKAILVTSTIKGEGKTFVSINIAHILSQLKDKKTIIIGADIRNPQLQRYFDGSRKMIGLTEFLYDESIQVDDIIITSSFDKTTSMILSGAIPPNPTELIMSKRLGELIDNLKTKFDFIIVDSAPLLLVSDTYYISGLVDLSVIVTRAGFTEKQLVEFPLKAVKDKKLNHPAFILNDVSSKSSGYGYKYGYNYGYGYGYHQKKKKSFFKRIIHKLKK